SSSQLRNFNANLNFNLATAAPYTIRTGVDTNGDLNFNDRPAGVGRNTERGDGQWSVNGFFNYGWTFGKAATPSRQVAIRIDGPGPGAASAGRFRLSLNVNVQNLTNHANRTGFVGTLTAT